MKMEKIFNDFLQQMREEGVNHRGAGAFGRLVETLHDKGCELLHNPEIQ